MTARPRGLELYRERLAARRANTAAEVRAASRESPEAGALAAARAIDAVFRRGEAGPNVACRAGCSSCCHVNVDVTAPELRAIVAHLRNDFTDLERRALVERLAARAAEAGALTDEARWAARLPCALLDGAGRCSVYAVRPLRCRSFHSTDAAACRAAAEGAPSTEPALDPALARLLDAVEAGYDDALGVTGARGMNLERALFACLEAEGLTAIRTASPPSAPRPDAEVPPVVPGEAGVAPELARRR